MTSCGGGFFLPAVHIFLLLLTVDHETITLDEAREVSHADLFCFYSCPCVFYKTCELSRSRSHTAIQKITRDAE